MNQFSLSLFKKNLFNYGRERRAPFNPATVKRLIQKDDVKVIVQPSNRRAYPMQVILINYNLKKFPTPLKLS